MSSKTDTLPFSGLSDQDVERRTAAGETNDTHQQTSRSLRSILTSNIFTRFNAIVTIMTIVVVSVGSPIDALFGGVAILNSAIGIFQELRAKHTLDKLALLHAPMARVIRDSRLIDIPINTVVLDDILRVQVGDQ